MAAMLLGRRLYTLLPTPAAGVSPQAVRAALRACPRYARLLDRWAWAAPLIETGTLRSLWHGHDAAADVTDARRRIATEKPWTPLRTLLETLDATTSASADETTGTTTGATTAATGSAAGEHPQSEARLAERLDLFAADLLKGGPDPAFSVPVHAGLDGFARRHGLTAVRAGGRSRRPGQGAAGVSSRGDSAGPSFAQQAEQRLAPPIASFAMPIVYQASSATLLLLRAALERPLNDLRGAIASAFDLADSTGSPAGAAPRAAASGRAIRDCAGKFEAEFSAAVADLLAKDDDGGQQVLACHVRVALVRLPADATLISAVAALRQFESRGSPTTTRSPSPAAGASTASTPAAPLRTLLIDPMAIQPDSPGSRGAASADDSHHTSHDHVHR